MWVQVQRRVYSTLESSPHRRRSARTRSSPLVFPGLRALRGCVIGAEWQQRNSVKAWDSAWASAKVSVYKTQKRYAFEKTSRCAAGRAEKR